MKGKRPDDGTDNAKLRQLDEFRDTNDVKNLLTSNQGVKINDDQNSLKAGVRGPTLLEDFLFREKITHFDHERIPERIVHARGSGAHGYFQVYEPLTKYSKAHFLQDPSAKTPVFVRFSTVAGFRGSTDLARDVRGFAVKFYTQEGNFDIVGNNMPVFFIQDAIKFPDLIHAVKPEPHNEIPQAASAHTTFWDFISLTPESLHTVMWLMSDRAIPRSYRMMEGFGVHTFRLVDAKGVGRFVKFHWKPKLGVHSVIWDEAQQISGHDPDFHRRDLWDSIAAGAFPEWEFGIQVVEEKDEHKFNFDLLDPTKIIPEELVPVERVGKLVLNRNPDNFFAETEQVAFCVGNIVPGIDFTNDPLMQGRLFSYLDTQLIRLGGPNFQEIPINRPIVPINNNQRDGHMRMRINRGMTAYQPNSIEGNNPQQVKESEGGFVSYTEKVDGHKIRTRSESFMDHYSQATLFWNSMSDTEKKHIVKAFRFELGMVTAVSVRERMVVHLSKIKKELAQEVAEGLGLEIPTHYDGPLNLNVPADANPKDYEPRSGKLDVEKSQALSQLNTPKGDITGRKAAILVAEGFDGAAVEMMMKALKEAGAMGMIIAPREGKVPGDKGKQMVDFSFLTASSALFDAVYVPGGQKSVEMLRADPKVIHFVAEAYKHCKPIAASGEGKQLVQMAMRGPWPTDKGEAGKKDASMKDLAAEGVIVGKDGKISSDFIKAMGEHRFWMREAKTPPPV